MTSPLNIKEKGRQPLCPAVLCVFAFFAFLTICFPSPVFATSDDPSAYTIRPGDTLDIQVAGHEEWSVSINVRPDGRITYPATGEIEVAGLTLQELTENIEHALGPDGRHLRDPNVFINVTGMRTPVVYIVGAVTKPGSIEISTGVSTAAKIITMAGGPTPDADLSRVTLYRDDKDGEVVDLQAALAGKAEQTIVRAGDVLRVPEIETRYVGVLGAAGKTGEVPLAPQQKSIDMLELLVKIGGVGGNADRERAMILRADGAIDSFALDTVLKRESDHPLVHGGDILWVPPAPETTHFAVTGAVQKPGQFEYREGLTLADALALSGPFSEAANPQCVTIIHADGEQEVINAGPMLHGQDTEIARIPIQPDDIVLVPAHDKSYVMLGAVGQPGFFPWSEGTRVADALAKAGGLASNAVAERVLLVRRFQDGGSPTVVEIDAEKLLEGKNEAANWKLAPGDTVYVPSREPDKGIRESLSDPLAVLGILGTLERVFNW